MSAMTLEQAIRVMTKVCGYAFNKAYGADAAWKVIQAELNKSAKHAAREGDKA